MPRDVTRATVMALIMVLASALAVAITPRNYMADKYPRERLAQIIPKSFGDWQVDKSIVPVAPSPDVQAVIDAVYDETFAVTFVNGQGQHMMLSLAYGRNQHKGMNTHRPEICYPSQGFKLVQDGIPVQLQVDGSTIAATRVVAAMGGRNEPITYWLLVGNQITQFGYPQRRVAIRYGLTGVIPDGVLVRVSSIGADNGAEFALQERFIAEMLAAMPPAQRARLLGAPA